MQEMRRSKKGYVHECSTPIDSSLITVIHDSLQRAAIRVIDETLHRLGKIHLIYGQPLHLVETTPQPAAPRPPKKPKLINASRPEPQAQFSPPLPRHAAHGNQPVAGSSRLGGATPRDEHRATTAQTPVVIPHARNAANAIASSSRVPISATLPNNELKARKTKMVGGPPCVVCGNHPHHLLKNCPVVAQGPLRWD